MASRDAIEPVAQVGNPPKQHQNAEPTAPHDTAAIPQASARGRVNVNRSRGKRTFKGRSDHKHKSVPSKKPRFDEYQSPDAHVAATEPSGRLRPVLEDFQLQISILGLDRIASYCYDVIKCRENRYPDPPFTRDQFKHVCNLAAFFKLYYSAIKLGCYTPDEYPTIMDDCLSIEAAWLPQIVCTYIDCIGRFEVDNMAIIPHVETMEDFFASPANPFFVLDNEGHRTPVRCTMANFMDQYRIGTYNRANIRASMLMHFFQKPKIISSEGMIEMCVTAGTDPLLRAHQTIPLAPSQMLEDQARRGAAFAFWLDADVREFGDWEYFANRFRGETFDSEMYLSTLINSSLC